MWLFSKTKNMKDSAPHIIYPHLAESFATQIHSMIFLRCKELKYLSFSGFTTEIKLTVSFTLKFMQLSPP